MAGMEIKVVVITILAMIRSANAFDPYVRCHSCISYRLAHDQRAFPTDILRAIPKVTDYCDQERFNPREVDYTVCQSPCSVVAIWDREAYGNYAPIGYVRGCVSNFVSFRPWIDMKQHVSKSQCYLASLKRLIPHNRRRSAFQILVDSNERMINFCVCNGTYCNGDSLRAGSARVASPVVLVALGMCFWFCFW